MTGALPNLTPEEEARYKQIQAQRQAKAPPPMSAQEFDLWYYQNVANAPEQTQYQQDQWNQFQQTPAGQIAPERGLSGGSFPGFMPTVRQAAGQPTYGYTAPKSPNYIAIYLDGAGKALKSMPGGTASPSYAMVDSAYMMAKGFVDPNGNLTPEGEDWVAQQVFWPYAVYRGAEDFLTYGQQAAESDNWNDWFWNSLAAAGGFLGMYPGGSPRMQFRPRPMRTGYPAVGKRDPKTGEPPPPRIDPNTGQPHPDIEGKPVFYSPAGQLLTDPQSPFARLDNTPLSYARWVQMLRERGVTKEEIRWMTNEARKRYGSSFDPTKTMVTRQQLAEIQYSSTPNLEVRAMGTEDPRADTRPVPMRGRDRYTDNQGYKYVIMEPVQPDPNVPPRLYRVVESPVQGRGGLPTVEVQISTDGKNWEHGWGYNLFPSQPPSRSIDIPQDIAFDYQRHSSSYYGSSPVGNDPANPKWTEHRSPDPVTSPRGDRRAIPGGLSQYFTSEPQMDNYQVVTIGLLDESGNPIDLPQGSAHPQDRNAIVFAPTTDGVEQTTGKRILKVHEIQSDAETRGRLEGYGPGRRQVDPRMPYQSPYEYTKAMVRALISHAARNGYDGIQFPTFDEIKLRWGETGGTKVQYEEYLPRAMKEVEQEMGLPPGTFTTRNPSAKGDPRLANNDPIAQRLLELPPELSLRIVSDTEALDEEDFVEIMNIARRGNELPKYNAYRSVYDYYQMANRERARHGQAPMSWDEFGRAFKDRYKGLPRPVTGPGFSLDPQTRRRIIEQGFRLSRMDPTMSGEEPTSAYG